MANRSHILNGMLAIVLLCTFSGCGVAELQMGLMGQNTPLRFYGMVIDQDGNPVPKVKIKVSVRHWGLRGMTMDDMAKEIGIETKTAVDGRFYLHGATGDFFDINYVQKDGYKLSSHVEHSYKVVGGSLANPIIFKMWKEMGKEPLVSSAWRGKVACDGTVNRFDLDSGHASADGNLEIRCTRVPLDLPAGNTEPFTWEVQIKILGGGIQPANDEFTYLAPEAGYLPVLIFGQKADDPKWDRRMPMPKEYYIRTSDGRHGTLSLEWDGAFWKSPTILKWDCSINPSGSRNLER